MDPQLLIEDFRKVAGLAGHLFSASSDRIAKHGVKRCAKEAAVS